MTEAVRQAQPVVQPVAQQDVQGQSTEQTATASEVVDRSSESGAMPADEDERMETPPADASGEAEAGRGSVEQSGDSAVEDSVGVDAEEQEPEPDEPHRDLTELPGTVVEDADVRVRPGLAWGVIDRLESGASVVVLHRAGGWYRIRYEEELAGWVRTTMLDLDEVEAEQVLGVPAPRLVADWQGRKYGVMGQSADGTKVRLLKMETETSSIIAAPIDEVTLLADDVTLENLPILIGDETVVFPGDDFGVGQGRILPKANEWMWLPWGWLLAHNDEYIWQWRPETDELEFVARPPGRAWLSPDGQRLGIIECPVDQDLCYPIEDVLFLRLDGTEQTSLRKLLVETRGVELTTALFEFGLNHLTWLGGGRVVLLSQLSRTDVHGHTAVLFAGAGDARLIEFGAIGHGGRVDGRVCAVDPPEFVTGLRPTLEADEVYIGWASCWNENDPGVSAHLVFDLRDEAFRLAAQTDADDEESVRSLFRSAANGDGLGKDLEVSWSASRRRALLFDFDANQMWIYTAEDHRLNAVQDHRDVMADAYVPARLGTIKRVFYWHGDEAVAVLARWGYELTMGAILVDAETGVVSPIEFDRIDRPRCIEAGVWSPNGSLFQTTFSQSTLGGVGDSYRGDWFWLDGTAQTSYTVWQHIISSKDDSPASMLRASGYGPYSPPAHLAGWSDNGEWLTFGGHQDPRHCGFGE